MLKYSVQGLLPIRCQRCFHEVPYTYQYADELAVCANDADAERLMSYYECILATESTCDIGEIITDELYLSSPQIPHERKDCPLDL